MTTINKLKIAWWINLTFLVLIALSVLKGNLIEGRCSYLSVGFFISAYYLFSTRFVLKGELISFSPLKIIQKISGYIMGFQGIALMLGGIGLFLSYSYQIKIGNFELILSAFIMMYILSLFMFVFGYSFLFYVRKSYSAIQSKNQYVVTNKTDLTELVNVAKEEGVSLEDAAK